MILYFTGTGNSRAVAERLGGLLDMEVVRLHPSMAADEGSPVISCEGESSLIWVFPVHSWGIPDVVCRIIRGIRISGADDILHHMVATCGDDCGYTDRDWRNLLSSRGWKTGSAFTVLMPNTYVSLPFFDVDSIAVEEKKLSAMPERTSHIAETIKSGRIVTDVTRGAFPRVKTDVIYPFFMKHLVNPRKFTVSDSCISCGKCVKVCPMDNVTLHDGHPKWGDNCCGCLACYHICPVHAINYGRFTRGKGQYYFKGTVVKA